MQKKLYFNRIDSSDEAIKLRIIDIRRIVFDGNNTQMAEFLGVTPSELSHAINGNKGIGMKFIKLIADKITDIDLNWLITGRGNIYVAKNTRQSEQLDKIKHDLDIAYRLVDTLSENIKLLKERQQWHDEQKENTLQK